MSTTLKALAGNGREGGRGSNPKFSTFFNAVANIFSKFCKFLIS